MPKMTASMVSSNFSGNQPSSLGSSPASCKWDLDGSTI